MVNFTSISILFTNKRGNFSTQTADTVSVYPLSIYEYYSKIFFSSIFQRYDNIILEIYFVLFYRILFWYMLFGLRTTVSNEEVKTKGWLETLTEISSSANGSSEEKGPFKTALYWISNVQHEFMFDCSLFVRKHEMMNVT